MKKQIMFLLHIKKNKLEKSKLWKSIHLKVLAKKIKKQILFLKLVQSQNKSINLRSILSPNTNFNFKSQNLIKYIVGFSMYSTNIIVYISDTKGKIRFFSTAGSLGLTRNQKRKKITVLVKLIKFMVFKTKPTSTTDLIALHFKNFNSQLSSFITIFLTNFYSIETIRIHNKLPHNGCRPRKLKRKKRKRIFFEKKL